LYLRNLYDAAGFFLKFEQLFDEFGIRKTEADKIVALKKCLPTWIRIILATEKSDKYIKYRERTLTLCAEKLRPRHHLEPRTGTGGPRGDDPPGPSGTQPVHNRSETFWSR